MSDNLKANAWFDENDDIIFSKFEMVDGKYVPPKTNFLKHLDQLINGEVFSLEWKCEGRRAPTPENAESYDHETENFSEIENTIDDGDFEFEDELNQLNLSSVRRTTTPKGSAKKMTTSLQSILSNIARHRKLDMLEDESADDTTPIAQDHDQETVSSQSTELTEHQLEDNEDLLQEKESQSPKSINHNFDEESHAENEQGSNDADNSQQLKPDNFVEQKRICEDNSTSEEISTKQIQLTIQQMQMLQNTFIQSNIRNLNVPSSDQTNPNESKSNFFNLQTKEQSSVSILENTLKQETPQNENQSPFSHLSADEPPNQQPPDSMLNENFTQERSATEHTMELMDTQDSSQTPHELSEFDFKMDD